MTDPAERARLLGTLSQVDAMHWKLALSASSLLRWELARVRVAAAEREDVKQHGYFGLLKAARRFEPSRGLRFSTYARWWVRAQMQDARRAHGRLVRLPASAIEGRGRLMELVEHCRDRGEPVDVAFLAEQTGISERQVRLLLRQGSVRSVEEDIGDGITLGDTLAVEPECEKKLIDHQLSHRAQRLFKALPGREQDILCRHFGLNGYQKESLAAIGRRVQLSRERVRQIEKLTLQAMAGQLH